MKKKRYAKGAMKPAKLAKPGFLGSAPLAGCMASLAYLLSACSHATPADETAAPAEPPKDAIDKTVENGPVKVETRVWPKKPTLDDEIYLRLDITAPAGISVEAPFQEAGDARLGRFRVLGFTRDSVGTHQVETYTLAAPSSGKHRVPPMRLEMIDTRAAKPTEPGKPQEILTDEIPLEVAPVNETAANAELKPAAGELDPDVGGTPWLVILAIASGAMIAIAGSVLAYRAWAAGRRRAEQKSAYDEAIGKLRSLEARGAPGAGDADAWFVELSAIVRRYLERRYVIRAPELTTEEFLQEAARAKELTGEHRKLLSEFLDRCDRVKFAGYRPDAKESIDTLAAARAFIEDTKVLEVAA